MNLYWIGLELELVELELELDYWLPSFHCGFIAKTQLASSSGKVKSNLHQMYCDGVVPIGSMPEVLTIYDAQVEGCVVSCSVDKSKITKGVT